MLELIEAFKLEKQLCAVQNSHSTRDIKFSLNIGDIRRIYVYIIVRLRLFIQTDIFVNGKRSNLNKRFIFPIRQLRPTNLLWIFYIVLYIIYILYTFKHGLQVRITIYHTFSH